MEGTEPPWRGPGNSLGNRGSEETVMPTRSNRVRTEKQVSQGGLVGGLGEDETSQQLFVQRAPERMGGGQKHEPGPSQMETGK